eukprot:UN01973
MHINADNSSISEGPNVPIFPLQLVVMGNLYSGKTEISRRLSEMTNCFCINVHEMIDDIINDEEKIKSYDYFQNENELIDDLSYCKFIRDTINNIDQSKYPGGYIIDGFPTTRAQAILLEKILFNFEEEFVPEQSQLLPTKAHVYKKNQSGFDSIIHCNSTDKTVLKRGLGRRVLHGEKYHLDYDPPLDRTQDKCTMTKANDPRNTNLPIHIKAARRHIFDIQGLYEEQFDKVIVEIDTNEGPSNIEPRCKELFTKFETSFKSNTELLNVDPENRNDEEEEDEIVNDAEKQEIEEKLKK